ncbi:MAG: cytochrome c biogenesis protein ResB [Pseudomonadota bacterium]|nr:cytochrome c biogenesis protein ResB [Pseudomonadota bacterium]
MKVFAFLKSAKFFTILAPCFMVYLVLGTLAQKYMGLHEATENYFYSWTLWMHGIPLPGFLTLAVLLLLNLTLFSITQNWQKKTYGLMFMHVGVIGLVLSMIFTPVWSTEGYISFKVGETVDTLTSYFEKEFIVEHNGETWTFNHDTLTEATRLQDTNWPFEVQIVEHCKNCKISARKEGPVPFLGMGANMQLSPKTLELKAEENLSGLSFIVSENGAASGFTLIDAAPIPASTETAFFTLNKTQTNLPFSVTLNQFKKTNYSGTDMAKAYMSDVTVMNHDGDKRTAIEMNSPLSVGDYTLYQSSVINSSSDTPVSVLAVVHNPLKEAPYVATGLIAFGLLAHALQKGRRRK